MRGALDEYTIGGIRTNRAFFNEILDDDRFRAGLLSTAFLEQFFERRKARPVDPEAEAVAALVAALTFPKPAEVTQARGSSEWLRSGREAELR
jgi:acetyl/propionyl-CoA carboxylase alpha subunit